MPAITFGTARRGLPGRAAAPPSPLLAVPNATAQIKWICNTTIIRLTCVLLLHYLGKSQLHSKQSYTLPSHKIKKNIQFVHKVRLHLSLNITASVQLASFFTHTGLKSLMSFVDSTVDNALQRASIKSCLRSATSSTGIWYTRSYITPHKWYSTGLRPALFWGRKSAETNFEVSRCSSSITWRARRASAAPSCW